MPGSKINVGIKASINSNDGVLEVYILDSLYDSITWDWNTGEVEEVNWVEDIIAQVKAANPSKIILYIDCSGGDCGIGLALYNFLKNYPARVETDVIGMCGSSATLPAMASSKGKLRMARNAFFVIHQAWGDGYGNSSDLRAAADVIDKYTNQMVDIYAQRTGKTADAIKALIASGDYWMTGSEAVTEGFADETYNDNPQFAIAARIKTLSPEYRNIPKNLISADITETTEEGGLLNTLKNEFMDFKSKVSAFISTLQGKTINAAVPGDKLAQEVANVMSEPMGKLVEDLQADVKADIDGLETKVGTTIDEKINAAITPLKETIKTLQDANAQLETDLAEKIGGPSEGSPKAEVGGIVPIGKGIKAKV